MQTNDIQAISAIAQIVLALASLITTVVLSLLVYYGTKKIAAIEYGRATREAWLAINATALSDDAILKAADLLVDPDSDQAAIDVRRKKWFGYMLLNVLETTFIGRKEKFLKDSYVKNSFKHTLQTLLIDEDVYLLSQERGYDSEFSVFCKQLRAQIQMRKSNQSDNSDG
jgi:hypothetical protein